MSGRVIGMGIFDGVHIGHQMLLNRVKELANAHDLASTALTFHPHPAAVLGGKESPPLITSLQQRRELILAIGVDEVRLYTFTRDFAAMPPENFVRQILIDNMNAKIVVVGFNFTFGSGGTGNPTVLKELGERYGFRVEVVEPVTCDGQVIGSTEIRRRLLAGDVEGASHLLRRNFSLTGKVVPGHRRGRTLGYPTANIAVPEGLIYPGDGVYAVRVHLGCGTYYGAVNIGCKPTFQDGQRTIEVFIIDFNGDIYDSEIKIEFIRKIREERKFSQPEELKDQICQDIAAIRRLTSTL